MTKDRDKSPIKYIPIYIFNIFFRDKKFYKPKSTQGGVFYIDVTDELMRGDVEFDSLLDIEEAGKLGKNGDESWLLKIRSIMGTYIGKIQEEFYTLEKNGWIKKVKLQTETKDTFTKKQITKYGTIPAGNITNILLKITVEKIYWDKFIDYIAEKRDEELLNWDIIGSSHKQKELIKNSIDTKRKKLERNDNIIMVGSQNYGDYQVNIQFLKTIKALEKDDLIEINSICVRTKKSFREMVFDSEMKEYFDIRIDLSITEKFKKEYDKNIIKKKEMINHKLPEKTKKHEKPKFSHKLPTNTKWEDITIRFKNDYDVDVRIGKNNYSYNYETLGFADNRIKKSEERTKAKDSWDLLQLLAIGNGKLPLNCLSKKEKEKKLKQKQSLKKTLKDIFSDIEGDPFFKHNDVNDSYKIKIKLVPTRDFGEDFRDKNIKEEKDNTGTQKAYEEQILNWDKGTRKNRGMKDYEK